METPIPATVTKQEGGLFRIEAVNPYPEIISFNPKYYEDQLERVNNFYKQHSPKLTDEDLTGIEQVDWNSFNKEVKQYCDFGEWKDATELEIIKIYSGFDSRTIWRREAQSEITDHIPQPEKKVEAEELTGQEEEKSEIYQLKNRVRFLERKLYSWIHSKADKQFGNFGLTEEKKNEKREYLRRLLDENGLK